jgi:hypothetical protein
MTDDPKCAIRDENLLPALRAAEADYTLEWGSGDLYGAAADEIERLRAIIAAAMAPTGEKPSTGRLRTFQRASNGPRTEPRLPSAAYGCRREADGSVCCAAWCGDIERCVRVDVAQWPTDEWYERAWEIASEVAKHNAAPRRLVFAYLVSQEMVNRLAAPSATPDAAREALGYLSAAFINEGETGAEAMRRVRDIAIDALAASMPKR